MAEVAAHRELTGDHGRSIVNWTIPWAGHPEHPFAIVVVNPQGEIVGQDNLPGATSAMIEEATQRAKAALAPGFNPETNPGGFVVRVHDDIWGAIGVAGRPGFHNPSGRPDAIYEPHDFEIARAAMIQFVSRGGE